MLICNDCEKTFEEPKTIMTTYEKYYGVGDLFGNHHSLELYCCPYCRSEDFEDYEEDEEI
jgi:hypothetical protein